MKFNSSRLRECNYKIDNLTLDQARQNGEVVRTSDSELLRAIRRIRGIEFDQLELDELLRKKKRKNSISLSEQIDKILYVPDIITIEFDDNRHYKSIIDRGGIRLNGKRYVRLLCSAGMARKSTVLFCDDEIAKEIREILNCGRDLDYEIAPSKFNAYIALASSATLRVPTPRFIIVSDCIMEREMLVDFLHESDDISRDPIVSPEVITTKVNLFDGQGLISPRMAQEWLEWLDLDYMPASWIFRSAFGKGLLVTFNYQEFAKQKNISIIKDIYGKEYNIEDVDVILSESQFKLAGAYSSIDDYCKKCEENDFAWGISRVSPKIDKNYSTSTYQYIQNLNITSDDQIEHLCKKTLDWFKNITGDDWVYTQLFLMGDIEPSRINKDWFDNLDNPLLQCLLLEPSLIKDKQINAKVQRLINKKIKESYLGILLLNANYQFMIGDPVAQIEWGLGLQVCGLLREGQHYSQYWNKRKIKKVSAFRSPVTYFSENNILDLQNTEEMNYWYCYLNSGIVFNVFGNDMMKMSGSDFDGDICMTTNQKEFVEGAFSNVLPPTYDRKTASKKKIVESELWEYDVKTFKSRIGLITNIGTELYALLPTFEKDSPEYNEVLNRLKICNCFQSMEIDRAKGIKTMDIPKYWTKWEHIDDNDSEETKKLKDLHHKTICDKRPYFFRYLYSDYETEYKKRIAGYDNYCKIMFDGNLNYIINKGNRNDEENRVVRNYYHFGNLLDSDCVMNNLCHHMESEVQILKKNNKLKTFDFKSLLPTNVEYKEKNKLVISNIHNKYVQFKKSINYHTRSSGFQEMMHWLKKQSESIVSSSDEVIYWASDFGSSFILDVFGDDLINVLKDHANNKFMIPIRNDSGHIDYMGSKYEIKGIDL